MLIICRLLCQLTRCLIDCHIDYRCHKRRLVDLYGSSITVVTVILGLNLFNDLVLSVNQLQPWYSVISCR